MSEEMKEVESTHDNCPTEDLACGQPTKMMYDKVPLFREQYGVDSAKRMVASCGDKFRPITPVKMLEMPEAFEVCAPIHSPGHFGIVVGEPGDFLGLGPDGTLFVVPKEDKEKIWKPVKR